jgi:hypothetical protein
MKTSFLFQARALLVAALLPVVAAAASELPSTLLQKGIYAEEIERNLDSAIKIYEQIAAEAAANRAVVAQAQYRLAVCYQKKGNKEQAIKLLNELMPQIPGDAALTRNVKMTLAAMGATPEEAMTVRKLSVSVPGWLYAMSMDGRYVAYQPKGGYDLAVWEVPTGKTWIVAKCAKGNSPTAVTISPDGKQIAYDVSSDPMIYLAKIDGSDPRKFSVVDDESDAAFPCGWSPDSTRVFVDSRLGKTGEFRTLAVDAKTGVKQEIGRRPASDAGAPGMLSPDGQWGARQGRSYPRKISIVDLKSGREETVLATDAGSVVGWVPGTTKLVFSRNRGATSDLLAVEIRNGKPVVEPEVLRSNFPNTGTSTQPLCITSEGAIYYFVRKDRSEPSELWVMEGFLAAQPKVAPTESWKIQTDIPTSELILGSDNSMLDRKFGFGATLPNGWTVSSAVRQGDGGNVVQFTSSEIRKANAGLTRIIYWPTSPWENPGSANNFAAAGPKPNTAAEIDTWLRNRLRERLDANLKEAKVGEGRNDRAFVSRVINGRHAVTVSSTVTQAGKPWIYLTTLVYGDKVIATCQLRVAAEKIDGVRPSFEKLTESIRLP